MILPSPARVDPAARRLKIAIVCSRNPLPMNYGDQLTVAHLMAFLAARGHTIDLYHVDAGGTPSEVQAQWIREQCRNVYSYPHGWRDMLRAAITALPMGLPFQAALFDKAAQRRDVTARAGEYDVIYTYYIRSGEVTRRIGRDKGPATFMAYQLSQSLNTRRISENAPNWRYRAFYALESRLVEAYEAGLWQDFTRSVLIGPADVEAVKTACAARGYPEIDNYVFGAHGGDIDRFAPRPDVARVPGRLIFCGVMRNPTNVQAVQWFASNVWPIVKAGAPEATWDIVGYDPWPEVRALEELDGVRVTGSVPDPAEYVAEAEVCINSMQAGAGLQNKLIEYLASGTATVATSVANEGIGARPDEHLLVADSPEAFAEAVLRLLREADLRTRLGKAGRQFAEANWSWEAHWLKLEQDFYDAIDGRPPSRIRSPEEALKAARAAATREAV